MPELPEVETIARTLSPQVIGRAVTAATLLHPKVVQAGEALLPHLETGAMRITRVYRRAKLLLFALSPSGLSASFQPPEELLLVFHLKMTGSFFVHPAGSPPLKHTRLILDLSNGRRLFFDDMRTFGYCRLMLPGQLPDSLRGYQQRLRQIRAKPPRQECVSWPRRSNGLRRPQPPCRLLQGRR